MKFDVVNSYAIITSPAIEYTQGMTVEAWINPSSVTGVHDIICQALQTNYCGIEFRTEGTTLRFRINHTDDSDDSFEYRDSPNIIEVGVLQHVVAVYDGEKIHFIKMAVLLIL